MHAEEQIAIFVDPHPRSTGKAYQVNVTDQKSVEKATDSIVQEFNGRLDVFVANAGIPWTKGAILEANDVSSISCGRR
jgi:NADP-dependent 3-hydroxy acid dehydrogenase YdfG